MAKAGRAANQSLVLLDPGLLVSVPMPPWQSRSVASGASASPHAAKCGGRIGWPASQVPRRIVGRPHTKLGGPRLAKPAASDHFGDPRQLVLQPSDVCRRVDERVFPRLIADCASASHCSVLNFVGAPSASAGSIALTLSSTRNRP
jgi:hypothetical protein